MRIRSIKPEFWRSSDISRLEVEDRLLFIALWSYVDDNGVGMDKLSAITADLFADDLESDPQGTFARVSRGLQKLSEAGRIIRYSSDGRNFLEVSNWSRHQRIDKPNKARYPRHDAENAAIRDTPARMSETLAPVTGEQGNRGTGETVVTLSDADAPDHDDDFALIEEETIIEDSGPTPGYPEDFNTFWATYPRRAGKGAACAAFLKAKKRAPVETILAGAQRLRDDPNLPPDGTLIAHPATWLNQDRWEDDPLPQRIRSKSDERLAAGFDLTQRAAARSMTSNAFPTKELNQ